MIIKTILVLMTASVVGHSQVPLGAGVVKIEFDGNTIIDFYNKPTDKTCAKRVEFVLDKSIDSYTIKDLDKQRSWLNPETIWLDYFQFSFRCKSVTNDWFEVIVNSESGQALWIRRNKVTHFVTWEEYLQGMFAVERREDEHQKIRTQPSDTAEELKREPPDCFKVKSIQGDWLEFYTSDYCDQGVKRKEIKSGWIKWRRGDKLLIRYYTTS